MRSFSFVSAGRPHRAPEESDLFRRHPRISRRDRHSPFGRHRMRCSRGHKHCHGEKQFLFHRAKKPDCYKPPATSKVAPLFRQRLKFSKVVHLRWTMKRRLSIFRRATTPVEILSSFRSSGVAVFRPANQACTGGSSQKRQVSCCQAIQQDRESGELLQGPAPLFAGNRVLDRGLAKLQRKTESQSPRPIPDSSGEFFRPGCKQFPCRREGTRTPERGRAKKWLPDHHVSPGSAPSDLRLFPDCAGAIRFLFRAASHKAEAFHRASIRAAWRYAVVR